MAWGIGMFLIVAITPAFFDSDYRRGLGKGALWGAAACTFLGIFIGLI